LKALPKISYRATFVLFVVVSALVFFASTIVILKFFDKTDVSIVSTVNIEKKYDEKLNILQNYFKTIDNSVLFLKTNENIKNFQKTYIGKENIKQLLETVKHSIPSIINIHYVTYYGEYKISTDDFLQKRSANRNILNDFTTTSLSPNLLVHKDNIQLHPMTNKPYVQLITLLDKQSVEVDFLVIDVDLELLFKQLQQSMLYDFYLIDEKGSFILHPSQDLSFKYLIENPLSIFDEPRLSNYAKNIISKQKYLNDAVFSHELPNFPLKNHKMVLLMKYNTLSQERKSVTDMIIASLAILTLIVTLIAVYFARKPDELLSEIKHQLYNDFTTKLPNKAQLIEDLEINTNKVIILIDVDNFKEINNVYGYDLADEMLKKYAKVLQKLLLNIPQTPYKIYKMPSNVFALTYTYNNNYSELRTTIEHLHKQIEKETISCGDKCAIYLSVTLGVSDPRNIHGIKEELIEAELALTMAKFNNKKYVIYHKHSTMQEDSENALYWTKEIKSAIIQDRILTFFQPIMNNKTKQIEKYEVLMRLLNSKGEIISPYQFMDIAKVSKHYIDLTKIVIHKAFSYFEKRENIEFSINISTLDLFEEGFISYLKNEIKYFSIADKLVIELIESENVNDYDVVEKFMKSMKKLGVKIAIDDFGSGYSNFAHIINLSQYIDYIKIDGSLIKNICNEDTHSLIILQTIQTLSKQLGIKTIAEFVDSEQKLKYIDDLGIDFAQGYIIGKPMGQML